jgi:hypothetical protein
MPPAIIAGGIAAVGAIGGAVLSSSAQKKAANQASDSQERVAQENNQLAREFRDENQANFQPWLQSGGRANALIDSFLYGGAAPAAQPQAGPPPGAPVSAHLPTQMNALGSGIPQRRIEEQDIGYTAGQYGQNFYNTHGVQAGAFQRAANGHIPAGGGISGRPATPASPATGGGNAMSGYETFVNSPYYQNPLQEGYRALNHGLASGGMLESGDAMKRATRYGQDYAYGRMGEYLGLAGDQSNRGVQAAGAIAGVGVNALNSMSSNNQNAANAASNAAIARGNANASMYSGIGSALGGLAGSFMPSSYGR